MESGIFSIGVHRQFPCFMSFGICGGKAGQRTARAAGVAPCQAQGGARSAGSDSPTPRPPKGLDWCVCKDVKGASRGRPHEVLLREPDAANPHVRFDERDVETERSRHRATSRLYPFNQFMGFYGLVFPAYVLLKIFPAASLA